MSDQGNQGQQGQQGQQVATIQQSRMPLPKSVATEYAVTSGQWRVLVDTIFPSAKTPEAVLNALEYCRVRKLDIFKRPVHIVPMYSTVKRRMVETIWPGISEIRTTATRTGEYAGMDEMVFGPMIDGEFEGEMELWENNQPSGTKTIIKKITYPEWASVIVYRFVKGEKCAFHTKIYWKETCSTLRTKGFVPNDMWEKRAIGQFDKCLEAAALRRAFPEEVGNTMAAEEMDGKTIEGEVMDTAIEKSEPPRPAAKAKAEPPRPGAKTTKPAETKAAETKPAETKPATQQQDPGVEDVDDSGGGGFFTNQDEATDVDGEQGGQAKEPRLPSDLLDELADRLNEATTEDAVVEVWNHQDIEAELQGVPKGGEFIGIAKGIYEQALRRVRKSGGKK